MFLSFARSFPPAHLVIAVLAVALLLVVGLLLASDPGHESLLGPFRWQPREAPLA